jgi:predicted nucleotidyltransferase
MLDLEAKHLTIIRTLLTQYAPHMTVWAYGSRVNGQGHAGSDLDLVIINPHNPNEPQKKLTELREALHDSNLPMNVDIHDWARIPEDFRTEIQKQYAVVSLS